MKEIIKNPPVHVSKIPVIELLAEINKRKLTATVTMLAKKFLPENCAHRLNNSFRFDSLKIISELLLEEKEISDLRHICRRCEFLSVCDLYRN
ncbi:MAG: hypothetical protein WC349_04360 [Patescibacteria group bacterium]|jgi:hypothetical protein